MSAEVEAMVFSGELPWHGLGTQISEDVKDVNEIVEKAGLAWMANDDLLYHIDKQGKLQTIKGFKALRRSDNGTLLSVVSDRYRALQNLESFKIGLQPFLDSKEATIETAGSLREGKIVFGLIKLKRDPLVINAGGKKDLVNKYLLWANGHGDKRCGRYGFTPIRVVCMNTLSAAENNADSQLIRIYHKGDVTKKLENVVSLVNAADASFNATLEQYQALANNTNVSNKDIKAYVKVVFGVEANTDRGRTRYNNLVSQINELFETGRGNADLPKSFWTLYNGVTEYLSYERGKSTDKRINSLWLGQGRNVNDAALSYGLQLAGVKTMSKELVEALAA